MTSAGAPDWAGPVMVVVVGRGVAVGETAAWTRPACSGVGIRAGPGEVVVEDVRTTAEAELAGAGVAGPAIVVASVMLTVAASAAAICAAWAGGCGNDGAVGSRTAIGAAVDWTRRASPAVGAAGAVGEVGPDWAERLAATSESATAASDGGAAARGAPGPISFGPGAVGDAVASAEARGDGARSAEPGVAKIDEGANATLGETATAAVAASERPDDAG